MSELEVDLPHATCYFTEFYWEETFNKAEYRICVWKLVLFLYNFHATKNISKVSYESYFNFYFCLKGFA